MSTAEKAISPINGQALPEGDEPPDGQVKVQLGKGYENDWIVLDTEKMTRAWSKKFFKEADQEEDLLSEILVRVSFSGYLTNAEALRNAWFIKKYHAVLIAVIDYLNGPNEETSPNSKS